MMESGPIGIFDSGYGGLTVMKEIVNKLPQYDYIYLGDNARAPYGNRSFDTVYEYTLASVNALFNKGCKLIILACNTASAKALRNIQQCNLPLMDSRLRVLGVIRPTTELIGSFSSTKKIGILATSGTVTSNSYPIEIEKFFPEISVFQQACPIWVPLIENNEFENEGADYFIKKHLNQLIIQSPQIDTILLGCTHYPLLKQKIKALLPAGINLLSQGEIVANSLTQYLKNHQELESLCSKSGKTAFYTTDSTEIFDKQAELFYGKKLKSEYLHLN
jgi:glutamate racemase